MPFTPFQQDVLKAHNVYRKNHGCPPLTLGDSLCKSAQGWADKVAASGRLGHSNSKTPDGKPIGENMFMMMGREVTGQVVTDLWYSEKPKYNFSKPGYQSGAGHFTQVVWKSSKELGVGMAKASNGAVYVCGQYLPAGNMNMPGQFEANVPKG